jgi:hypothetical protein
MPCSAELALGLVDCYYQCRRRWSVFHGQRGLMDVTGWWARRARRGNPSRVVREKESGRGNISRAGTRAAEL